MLETLEIDPEVGKGLGLSEGTIVSCLGLRSSSGAASDSERRRRRCGAGLLVGKARNGEDLFDTGTKSWRDVV